MTMLGVCCAVAVGQASVAAGPLRLWYRAPATVAGERETGWSWQNSRAWSRALPVGNGRLGGMVFGGVPIERVQLNELSLWSGWPYDADNPDAARVLPEIRRLLFEGRYADAEKLTYEKLACKGPGSGSGNGAKGPYGSYETLGDLRIAFDGHEQFADYRRELDLRTGVASVSYKVGGATFRREVLSSAPARALVVRLTCDRPRSLTFTASLSRPECAVVGAEAGAALVMGGRLSEGKGIRYAARLQVAPQGGKAEATEAGVRVTGANSVTLILTAATDYRTSAVPSRVARDRAAAASARAYSTLRNEHIRDHQRLFDRVDLELPAAETATLPTDERLAAYASDKPDPTLEALYFQYGRYLLIASSRPGGLPANLQGIWAESIQTPWNGDYHHNINDQMNYWPAETTNLAECHEPFLDFIGSLVEPGRKTAKVQYGLNGWVVHTISNIWGYTSPGEHPSWGQFPAAGAWLCRHIWERYLFGGDRRFLARAYPTMRECARFFLEFLVEDPKTGVLVTAPSNSPENAFKTPDGTVASVCYGPTMDMQILRELFGHCIEAAGILNTDKEFADRLRSARNRLSPNKIGKDGRLQEWIEEFEEPEPGHRHMSHLYGLHPGYEITPRGTPELARAARASLERRLASGGGHTGWSRAWVVNFWARLEDGDQAYSNLRALLARSTLPNLFDNHPPFQIDGNFGGTAGVAEMLLQSHASTRQGENGQAIPEIALLPALPARWPEGSVRGLCARGGLVVDLSWSKGALTTARIQAVRSATVMLRCGKQAVVLDMKSGQAAVWDGRSAPVVGRAETGS
ncbi:MAG: glycoside hydrolase family 95 protein [Armatimonadetes bacterium]|nr:glycoside hydrolase family 95 protein [Armatimonadota bacterium]